MNKLIIIMMTRNVARSMYSITPVQKKVKEIRDLVAEIRYLRNHRTVVISQSHSHRLQCCLKYGSAHITEH